MMFDVALAVFGLGLVLGGVYLLRLFKGTDWRFAGLLPLLAGIMPALVGIQSIIERCSLGQRIFGSLLLIAIAMMIVRVVRARGKSPA